MPAVNQIAHILVCTGGACTGTGQVPAPAPPPVDRLKLRWKTARWYGRVHLTFTGCLGRCGTPSQALIVHARGAIGFGGIADPGWWDELGDWAGAVVAAGRWLDPQSLDRHRIQPWA